MEISIVLFCMPKYMIGLVMCQENLLVSDAARIFFGLNIHVILLKLTNFILVPVNFLFIFSP